ncbi:unnamed protein product, partial [Iphiclides podalirius]
MSALPIASDNEASTRDVARCNDKEEEGSVAEELFANRSAEKRCNSEIRNAHAAHRSRGTEAAVGENLMNPQSTERQLAITSYLLSIVRGIIYRRNGGGRGAPCGVFETEFV